MITLRTSSQYRRDIVVQRSRQTTSEVFQVQTRAAGAPVGLYGFSRWQKMLSSILHKKMWRRSYFREVDSGGFGHIST